MTRDELGIEVARHLEAGTRIAAKKLRNLQDAEDACQDAVLWCLEHWTYYDSERGTIKSWFLQRVNSECGLHWRQRRGQAALGRTFEDIETLTNGDGRGCLEMDGLAVDLEACWELLSARQRQVIELKSAGHPLRDICAELQLSPSMVKRHLARAKRKIRNDLEIKGHTL